MDQLSPWLFGGSMVLTLLTVIASVICSVVPIVAIAGGLFYLIRKSSKESKALNEAAQSWPSTTGQITKSRVEVSGGDHTSVSPRIEYQYEVNGMPYLGTNLRAGDVKLRIAGNAYDVVDRYPVGATVTVYYNPANPAQSALER